MAQAASLADRGPSPLGSNNPFRSRLAENAISPGLAPVKPVSTNPFLDSSEIFFPDGTSKGTTAHDIVTKPPRPVDQTTDFFASLELNDPAKSSQRAPTNGATRRENMPPRPYQGGPPGRHKPSNSDEERRRQQSKQHRGPPNELDIFADPSDKRPREKVTQRRNSESSVRDRPKESDPEAEKRRRERKLREKEAKGSTKSKKPNARLDIIDKLDVTSIYGTGLFHHDGPFDACNPHRNRKGSRQAPMQAFPKDSVNMALGGSGPLNKKINLEQYHGTGQEAHVDYNEAAVVEEDEAYFRRPPTERSTSAFNAIARIEPVHGSETAGLGTSTFLEGAPASRAAIQRRESEYEAQQQAQANGLSRKKSLAQRIKSVRPKMSEGGRMTSPEPIGTPNSPLGTGRSENNANPFFKDYDKEYEKKGAQIAFAEDPQKPSRSRAPSSPRRGLAVLERKLTVESLGAEEGKTGGGFLSRVKSLKGGSRTRGRRNTETS
ncbi:hypothetical protein LTR47_002279 [Exophiala xenobiotica]|nr:hypothetical protein LTR47_002279 [Exophiala xenobiotica]KAK5248852.1 hypothetical protein LTS06_006151 [Exophiala xenobiotica]KAK5350440.1 hypothetical protein LTR61_005637 [Exophiala xenobiotica]KAK5359348.1 hypothetical protein LTR11_010532 [Exophiala xenobiotica]KAK5359797.1 hypothetical protein LTS03_010892 [Exophiala xenobiotica]